MTALVYVDGAEKTRLRLGPCAWCGRQCKRRVTAKICSAQHTVAEVRMLLDAKLDELCDAPLLHKRCEAARLRKLWGGVA